VTHGRGRRCKHGGCSKPVARGPGSAGYCAPCLLREKPHLAAPTPSHARRRTAVETDSDDDDEPEEEEDDDCTLCGERGGFLIGCTFCARSFHFDCLDTETLLGLTTESDGDAAWACPRKVCKVPVPPYKQRPLGREGQPLECERWCPDRSTSLGEFWVPSETPQF
jgi:hypothetical protein